MAISLKGIAKRVAGAVNRQRGASRIRNLGIPDVAVSLKLGAVFEASSVWCRGEAQRLEAEAIKYGRGTPSKYKNAVDCATVLRTAQESFAMLAREYNEALAKIRPDEDEKRLKLADQYTRRRLDLVARAGNELRAISPDYADNFYRFENDIVKRHIINI